MQKMLWFKRIFTFYVYKRFFKLIYDLLTHVHERAVRPFDKKVTEFYAY
jgi:hypothetical protein